MLYGWEEKQPQLIGQKAKIVGTPLDGEELLGVHEPLRGSTKDAPDMQQMPRKARRYLEIKRNAIEIVAIHLRVGIAQSHQIEISN